MPEYGASVPCQNSLWLQADGCADYTSRHQTGVEPGYGTEAPYNSANQETAAAPYTSEHLPGQPTHQQHQNSSLNPTRNNDNDSAPGAYESGQHNPPKPHFNAPHNGCQLFLQLAVKDAKGAAII